MEHFILSALIATACAPASAEYTMNSNTELDCWQDMTYTLAQPMGQASDEVIEEIAQLVKNRVLDTRFSSSFCGVRDEHLPVAHIDRFTVEYNRVRKAVNSVIPPKIHGAKYVCYRDGKSCRHYDVNPSLIKLKTIDGFSFYGHRYSHTATEIEPIAMVTYE